MMMRLALAAAAILATTACATAFVPDLDTPDTRPVLPSAAEDTCNARQYAALIGQPVTSPGVPPPTAMSVTSALTRPSPWTSASSG